MTDRKELIEQAERTYEQLNRHLESAIARGQTFPARGQRTTAYAALQGYIQRLEILQAAGRKRLRRRQVGQK